MAAYYREQARKCEVDAIHVHIGVSIRGNKAYGAECDHPKSTRQCQWPCQNISLLVRSHRKIDYLILDQYPH